ncbi:hypothetical protein [Halopseudomonas pelagia]|uniref:Uncharacterized protein n=1 Tax=Halopseudomonas pelagia TaxID=553151 RepID=A0AA91U284_9GAMM|nr:hypothetical protein [Halopseudomonas pelagia]PCC99036.1 hypothetical protein CO192_12465 [Halopseudomonas pelagia]QFY57643.1 hypothetical protein EAO82_15470 [Halopseudomonas pelagia]
MASPKISAQQQRKIEVMLTKWSGKLTWEALVSQLELAMGLKTTRQTLSSYAGIAACYKKRKAQLRGATPAVYTKISLSDITLIERIERLEAEIIVLTRNNAEQLRMIERMLANARSIPNLDLKDLIQSRPEESLKSMPRRAR